MSWSAWIDNDGSGIPPGLEGATVEVATTRPVAGRPDALRQVEIVGLTLKHSFSWTWESRMDPSGRSTPIDAYRIWIEASGVDIEDREEALDERL